MKIGLALGSGVARGWAHIGVLRALDRAGLKPDIVCGTSIGALVGGVWLGGHLDGIEQWALKLSKTRLPRLIDFQLGGSGIIAGRRVMQVFPPELMATRIEDLPTEFLCVATDLATGHEVWLREGSLVDAIRASCAIPGLVPPVKLDGRWLIDGALANPVPVTACRILGARITIAINLNGESFGESPAADGLDFPEEAENGGAIADPTPQAKRRLRRPFFRRDAGDGGPSVFAVMARSLHIVQDRIARSRLAGDPPDVMIFPQLADIGILEFHRAKECIAAGESATEAMVPRIKEMLRRLRDGNHPWERGSRKNGRP